MATAAMKFFASLTYRVSSPENLLLGDAGQPHVSDLKNLENFDFKDAFGPVSRPLSSLLSTYVVLDGKGNTIPNTACVLGTFHPHLSGQHNLLGRGELHNIEPETSVVPTFSPNLKSTPVGSFVEIVDKKATEKKDGIDNLNLEEDVCSGKLGPQDFELLACIGDGGFGKVFQCQKRDTNDIFAMKVINKSRIMDIIEGTCMGNERDILTKVVHPFIVKLHYSFQTRNKLYLILDFINGLDLSFHLKKQKMFSEELARIYTAEIVCAVSYLHKMGIMHRDIKPENVLVDAEGHVKLIDFGLANEVDDSTRSYSVCGTPEYMAPEVIWPSGHDKSADWWSLGILLYQMLIGQLPFVGENRYKLQKKILNENIKLPSHLSSEATSLLKGLLHKDPSRRLGSGPRGSDEIKNHKWFKSIDWGKVEERELRPKFQLSVNGIHCTANFDKLGRKVELQDSLPSSQTLTKVGANWKYWIF